MPSKRFIKPFKKDSIEYRKLQQCHQSDFVMTQDLLLPLEKFNLHRGQIVKDFKKKMIVINTTSNFSSVKRSNSL